MTKRKDATMPAGGQAAQRSAAPGTVTVEQRVVATPAEKQTTGQASGSQSGGEKLRVTAGRSGGKVDAPGKTHRKPPTGARGIKHSDEVVAKLKGAQTMRRGRRRG
jgi:hypothetical protein